MAKTKRVSKQEYAQMKREEQRELLAQAVNNLCSSEGWQQYLQTRAKFHNYSFSNTILIALQCPEATQVAGAKKWSSEFNRLVTKGEKAIKILAPNIIYAKDEAGNVKKDEKGNKIIDHIWYRTVNVFDISQTEGDPVPTIPMEPLTGESHEEYLYRAEQYAQSLGVTVRYETWAGKSKAGGERRGYYVPDTKTIVVNDGQPVNSQVRTMIHELAHAHGVDYTDYTRQQAEVIVESAAYLACHAVGLDTSGMTVPYIASWGVDEDDPKKVMAMMKEFAGKIDELAKTIEEAIS